MNYTKVKIFAALLLISAICHLPSAICSAQEPDLKKAKRLEALIVSNPKDKQVLQSLDELSEIYFRAHQYAPLIDILRKLEKTKPPVCELPVGYYIGLCRYHQLKYLEETQNWQEYFDAGNGYRQELFLETEKAAQMCPQSAFGLRAQMLNWLQHKTQNDAQAEEALSKLGEMIQTYARQSAFDLEVIKEAADTLAKNDESALGKSAYNIYVKGLLVRERSPDILRSIAESSLSQGNIDLAQTIYERYIELSKASLSKDNLAKELTAIIRQFAADGWTQGKDPVYAEKVFGILQESCGKSYMGEELQYLRAYNLERLKEYGRAIEEYETFAKDFPKSAYLDEVEFKLGVLYAYILGQKETGLAFWQKLIERDCPLEYKLDALYHKSLLSQYNGESETAKSGYAKILELISAKAADFKDLSGRVAARQKEIEEVKPIEYNLKTFLDAIFGQASAAPAGGLELMVNPYKALKKGQITFSSQQMRLETGCLAPMLIYLWSGDLGSLSPIPVTPEFTTGYTSAGAKVVNLVVLSGQEVIGAALEMAEVYDKR